jgi:uncharacterized BrkB/YihY/UPF0761 family membrane protein
MSVLLFPMIYKYVPRETIAWRDVWVGAAGSHVPPLGALHATAD